MKYTDTELEKILNGLISSTRSPQGRFSAAAGYPKLEMKLRPRLRRSFATHGLVAAAAVILLCLSVWTAYLLQPVSIQTISTLAETRTVKLPDGTSVTLNHYSSLSYPERFKSGNREVKLINGEAYFEVTKDKEHPFIVCTETIDVQVLGTHFNINAYRDNPDVITTLLTGSVAVSNKDNSNHVVLKPDEVAIYNKAAETLIRKESKNAKNEISWCQNEFIFDELPLRFLVQKLSNSFGATIHIADTALLNYRITARFRNGENLETILFVLHKAGYFNYSQNNKQFIITTKPDLK